MLGDLAFVAVLIALAIAAIWYRDTQRVPLTDAPEPDPKRWDAHALEDEIEL